MSNLDSWEEDPAAQDDSLSQQTQRQMNLNGQGRSFQPGAQSFQPGAQTFQPGQAFPQYGGYNQQYSQYGQNYGGQQPYGGQSQYGQNYGGQPGYGGYNQGHYGGYGQGQGVGEGQTYVPPNQRQQQQTQQIPTIAKRSQAGESGVTGASDKPAATSKAGVLSIGGNTSPAPKAPKTLSLSASDTGVAPKPPKTLSLSAADTGTTPASKPEAKTAETGAKVQAAKAIEKTKEPGPSTGASTNGSTTLNKSSSGRNSPSQEQTAAEKRAADAVAVDQEADVDEETLEEVYGKEHVNVIFIGHVDAGKSTLGGSILYATGMVDERTMDKYKREAKEAGRETWYLSWALDLTKEERSKGKTVEVGRGFFETERRRYSILDAPGHKTFVPNMIGGASQADIGVLVISARKGEYETGFEKGGQTREHAILAKTQGVNQLIVVINKMDDPTVEWSQERYKECSTTLTTFLRQLGYSKADLTFMPVSAQTTINIKERIPKGMADWYQGPSLLEHLDGLKSLERKIRAPFMMPVSGKYRELGTMIEGKIEAGVAKKNGNYVMMPNRVEISCSALFGETEDEIQSAGCGEQVRMRLRGIEEEDILPGFVLCSPKRPVHCVSMFEAQIRLMDLKSILTAGYNCVLHVHSAIEEVQFDALLHKLEKGTNRKSKKPPPFANKGQSIIARLKITGGAGSVCVERFEDYPQMGRFTLRDQVSRAGSDAQWPSNTLTSTQGATIAIGKITKLISDPAAENAS